MSGGEPSCYGGFFEILDSIKSGRVQHVVYVVSNLWGDTGRFKRAINSGVKVLASLHETLSKHEISKSLVKIKEMKHANLRVRILTRFSNKNRLIELIHFMKENHIGFDIGLIYTIKNKRFVGANNTTFPLYTPEQLNTMTRTDRQRELSEKINEMIPHWARVEVSQSGGLGAIDTSALKNFILYPDYFSARKTKVVKCKIPARHLTVYPNGSAWVCNNNVGNVFDGNNNNIPEEILCPDYGRCMETCTDPPFVEDTLMAH
jgi:hypothetical protein